MEELTESLAARAAEGLRRELHRITARHGARITIEGREYLDLGSNDYLGLSSHPDLVAAAQAALAEHGTGAGASRLLSGSLDLHHRLEEAVARFKGTAAALVFNSGYQANLGIISALVEEGDCVLADRLAHASILDGARLAGARRLRFRHNDPDHLAELLRRDAGKYRRALVVTESVFSMDGDLAPLRELVAVKEQYGARLLVDEAHATGVFGPTGAGLVEELGLVDRVDLVMGTFSKALGSFGAYLAASATMVEWMVNTARSFIYSTALPPAVIAANLAALQVVRDEPERRARLLAMAADFRAKLEAAGWRARGESQIVPLIVGENAAAAALADQMRRAGCWTLPIRYPTVPLHESRLRFSLTCHHTPADLDGLLQALAPVMKGAPSPLTGTAGMGVMKGTPSPLTGAAGMGVMKGTPSPLTGEAGVG